MDEISRLASDVQQVTSRVDDLSYRVAAVEIEQKHSDTRVSDLKTLIIEKNNDLRADIMDLKTTLGKIIWWVVSLVGGAIGLAILNLVLK